jgi:hypothetical protein
MMWHLQEAAECRDRVRGHNCRVTLLVAAYAAIWPHPRHVCPAAQLKQEPIQLGWAQPDKT